MPTTELIMLLSASLLAGLAMGAFHFGSLWLTVQRLGGTEHPVRGLLCSQAVRFVVTLGVFAVLIRGHWSFLAIALLGFLLARGWIIRHWGLSEDGGPKRKSSGARTEDTSSSARVRPLFLKLRR